MDVKAKFADMAKIAWRSNFVIAVFLVHSACLLLSLPSAAWRLLRPASLGLYFLKLFFLTPLCLAVCLRFVVSVMQ